MFASKIIVPAGYGPLHGRVPAHVPVTDLGAGYICYTTRPFVLHLRAQRPTVAISTIGVKNLASLAARPLWPKWLRVIVREAYTTHRDAAWPFGRVGS